MPELYTLGYARLEAKQRLDNFMAQPSAILADIRYRPVSRWRPLFGGRALHERFDARYVYVQELGNTNYADHSLPIQLVNPAVGVQILLPYLEQGYMLCLLCACSNPVTCHRSIVARLVQKQYPCEIVHL